MENRDECVMSDTPEMAKKQRETQIQEQLGLQNEALNILWDELYKLSERLIPVLRKSLIEDCCEDWKEVELVEFANTLRNNNDTINRKTEMVIDILNRLEL